MSYSISAASFSHHNRSSICIIDIIITSRMIFTVIMIRIIGIGIVCCCCCCRCYCFSGLAPCTYRLGRPGFVATTFPSATRTGRRCLTDPKPPKLQTLSLTTQVSEPFCLSLRPRSLRHSWTSHGVYASRTKSPAGRLKI